MRFAKLHGLGNDFLVARAGSVQERHLILAELARKICDRHCGVGADGILFYEPTVRDPEADFSALIFNADGSKAEMSGNGVRCLAAFLHQSGEHSREAVRIRTIAGIKRLEFERRDGNTFVFRSSLGQPITEAARLPCLLPGPGPILGYPLEVGNEVVNVTLSSMGNPHCSTFWRGLAQAPGLC